MSTRELMLFDLPRMSKCVALPLSFLFAIGSISCSKEPEYKAQQFVGAWKSSRLASRPLYLMANGEWEIRSGNDVKPLQYGVWQVHGKALLWTHRSGGDTIHDRNPIVSAELRRFVLREQDGSLTQFDRLEE